MSSLFDRHRYQVLDLMESSMEARALLIPFEAIESVVTGDEDLIGSYRKCYQGQILQPEKAIDIVIREFHSIQDDLTEIMMLCLLQHENISSILLCAIKNDIYFLVCKVEANGSLAEHLSASSTTGLTWAQRLSICIGVGQALKYIHSSDSVISGYYVIHGNIKSSEILLDDSWQPKLQGFESAMFAERNTVYITSKYEGSLQYKDPAYEKTGSLTAKSDVFSFGVVLFEVLFGRKASASTPNEQADEDNWNFAEFARLHWKNNTLYRMIDPDMRKHMDSKSFKIFSNVAYACLTEQREERPNMDQVVKDLEESLRLQKYHEHSMVTKTSSRHLQGKTYEHLMIPLKDILLATERFHSKNKIGAGGFATVYKAELEHFQSVNSSTIEGGGDDSDMRKISNTVAIKLISRRANDLGEKGFIAEVQMLSKCKHPNIVSLLGFCDEGPRKILIYEYVPNGSLDGYLERSYRMTTLTWGRRLQICLDVAHGLEYLHSGLNGNEIIIHRDIKSANILLDDNLRAKIADFGLSRLYTINSKNSTINTVNLAGTELYLDPEYIKTGKLKKASDIYSFGVVLFEILCGRLAHDKTYNTNTEKGLPSIARRLFNDGKSKTIVDPSIKETDGSIFSQSRVADQHSLDTFIDIANQCLVQTQDERPTIEEVIKELEKAINYQKNNQDNLQLLLEDINLATQSFSDCNCIGEGKFWKLYRGEVPQAIYNAKGYTAIVVKRWNKSGQGHQHFFRELEFAFKNKHDNVTDLVGYCTEMEEKIIVYEHSSKGSLDKHLNDVNLTWMERLKICINVASGLEFLHDCGGPEETVMMHGDIKSGSILIDGDLKAKVSNLELISLEQSNLELSATVTFEQSVESDIYALGVLLFEVLFGRLASEDPSQPLGPLTINGWSQELDEMVFEGIKDQIDPLSLSAFTETAKMCFCNDKPRVGILIEQLMDALEYQKYIEESPKVSLSDINLSSDKCIQEGRYWKLYEAQIPHANGWINVYAKCWDNKSREAHTLFFTELRILLQSNNKHVVAFVGYCNEMNKKFIFYERASNNSLDKHLDDARLTWKMRLGICMDIAKGLQYLHGSDVLKGTTKMKHATLKSSSILIDDYWKAKIANLEFYPSTWFDSFDYGYGSPGYVEHGGIHQSTMYVDVYALGVVFLEMLCGRLAWPEGCEDHSQSLGPLAKRHYNEKQNLDELVFEGIREQIDLESSIVFQDIAIQCLETGTARPQAREVVDQLKKAFELRKYVEDSPQLSLEDIKQGTQKFRDDKCIGEGRYWKLYEEEILDANTGGYETALMKRWDSKSRKANHGFFTELRMLLEYRKVVNIVNVEGYINEMDEKIIVYEHGYNRCLNNHLDDASLSWTKRLKICIDVASVLNQIQYFNREGRSHMVHEDIRSGSILIDGDWNAKLSNIEFISDFSFYKPLPDNAHCSLGYFDPHDERAYMFKDIYAFGVVLMEMLCGRLAWPKGCEDHSQSLAPLAKRHHKENGNFDELVFEGIKEQIAPESLIAYQAIALACIQESWSKPTVYEIVTKLENALELHEYVEESPQISLEDIKSATHNFGDEKCIGEGRYWKLYEGEFPHAKANGQTTALVKRWDRKSSIGRQHFFRELRIPFQFKKNENVVSVEGYCSERDEKIIVFEHAYNRSLDKHLDNTNLSWMKRLKICINVAGVLDIFHNTGTRGLRSMIHGDIKSGSILIDGDWNAKVSNFEVVARDGIWIANNKAHSSLGYADPLHKGSRMSKDIYAFGVVLLEMLCGRLAWPEECKDHSRSLGQLAQKHYKEKGNLDELVFEGIKEQISPKSLIAYQEIALKCIADTKDRQTVEREMVKQLKNALELQEDYENMLNSKLPKEYKEYIQMSKTPEVYSTEVIKDLYNILTNGILLQPGKLLFTLGANEERYQMISAMTFSYKNRPSRIWQSIPESRFRKVAQMWDISNLKIQIRINTQFLSLGINYGVYLVFKFCQSRKSAIKRQYVNLSYKKGEDNLHAYFATWRDDEWMMIELYRFSNDKKYIDFEATLKSFSRYYCGSRIIYVEGIEFRSIDNASLNITVKYEEIEKSKDAQQVLKSLSNMDEVQQSTIGCREISKIFGNDEEGEKMFSVNEANRKNHPRLSPMEFLCDSSNMKPFDLKPSSVTRSQGVEFLQQQVFRIKCKIESQMLSSDTDYTCYLVFKLSEKCNGLHGPVIIRDLLKWKNKETGTLYFRTPSPWNLHDTDSVPRERKDGWMEVAAWKFNSKSNLRNDGVPMNLKLVTYVGTMSGLIVCSLEIRPI